MMPHSAMVMAAGFGTRMQPLTLATPKPMLQLGGKPLIDYALDHIAAAGIGTVVVNLHYLGDQIERHVSARSTLRVHFQHEDQVLETGGGALMALPILGRDQPFFVFNADTVYMDGQVPVLQRMAELWDDQAMDVLLLVVRPGQGDPAHYAMAGDGRLSFLPADRPPAFAMRAVSLMHPRLFAQAPEGKFSLDRLWRVAESKNRLFGLEHDGLCYHLSTPKDLAKANRDLQTPRKIIPA